MLVSRCRKNNFIIQHPFMIKTVSKLGLEKNFFNWIKVNYQNSTVICILPNRAASEAGLKKKKWIKSEVPMNSNSIYSCTGRRWTHRKRPYNENIWLLDPFGIFWFRGHHNFHICCKYFAGVQFHISVWNFFFLIRHWRHRPENIVKAIDLKSSSFIFTMENI